ncbi:MAG TPA: sigma-70 family RNA polymerase sigma factor [Burkholderiales bacterium]|nr:sigma-70 family RNA polymerase sigma factor [Burkholderiales bacterium]
MPNANESSLDAAAMLQGDGCGASAGVCSALTPRPQAVSEIQLQTWIQRITRQDEPAFAAFYEACVGRVYGLALRITRDAAQAEEVAEDTFWQTWREAPRFDPARGTAMSWLLTMARSRALDSLRARDPAESVEDADELRDARGERDASPLDLLSATQTDHTLHHALAQLDAQPRQLIALAFFRGLTHDEIATHTGIPLGTVKSHIRRGLTTLKTLLGDTAGQRPEGL